MENTLLWRGRVALAHQPQMIRRDMCGDEIARHFGGTAMGYRLTGEQFEDRCRTGKGGLPYEYLVYSPRSAAFNWTAFFSREEMDAWLEAYDCSIDGSTEPGDRFTVVLPASDANWLPLTEHEPDPALTYLSWGGEARIVPDAEWTDKHTTSVQFAYLRFTRQPNFRTADQEMFAGWIAQSFLTIKKEQ